MNKNSRRVVVIYMIQNYEPYFRISCFYGNLHSCGVYFGRNKIHKKIGRKYLLRSMAFCPQDKVECVNSIEEITKVIDPRICKILKSYEVFL